MNLRRGYPHENGKREGRSQKNKKTKTKKNLIQARGEMGTARERERRAQEKKDRPGVPWSLPLGPVLERLRASGGSVLGPGGAVPHAAMLRRSAHTPSK